MILLAIVLTVGMLLVAFVLDIGLVLLTSMQLQGAVDAAALAGANESTIIVTMVGGTPNYHCEFSPGASGEAQRILQRNLDAMGLISRGVRVEQCTVVIGTTTVQVEVTIGVPTYLVGALYEMISGDNRFRKFLIRRVAAAEVSW